MTRPKSQRSKWWDTMIGIHGSRRAVRQFMREQQKKSRENPNSRTGGFHYLKKTDPEKLSEVASKGGKISKRYKKDVRSKV